MVLAGFHTDRLISTAGLSAGPTARQLGSRLSWHWPGTSRNKPPRRKLPCAPRPTAAKRKVSKEARPTNLRAHGGWGGGAEGTAESGKGHREGGGCTERKRERVHREKEREGVHRETERERGCTQRERVRVHRERGRVHREKGGQKERESTGKGR